MIKIIMGSISDLEVMKHSEDILKQFDCEYSMEIVSAHRTPDKMYEFARNLQAGDIVIAGAGGAAHLPGMVAAMTACPVIGVPIKSKALNGVDSLLSIVQMPKGVSVATVAINGSENAALLALQMIALTDTQVRAQLIEYRLKQTQVIEAMEL